MRVLPWILCLVFAAGNVAAEDVQLKANISPPYADEKLPERGVAIELVEHIFAATSYRASIDLGNWSRALEGAEIGIYSGLAAAWYTPERSKDLLFSDSYLDSEIVIVKLRKQRAKIHSPADLSGWRLGTRADYAYGVDFAAIPDIRLVEENYLIQSLLNLLNGKVDFVVGDKRTVIMEIDQYLGDRKHQLELIRIGLPNRARHLAISRDLPGHEKLVSEFNQALKNAKQDGSHAAIIDKWTARYKGVK